MSGDSYIASRQLTVGIGQAERDAAALRWAAAEAASRGLPLRVVHAYQWQPGPVWAGRLRPVPDSVLQEVRHAAAERLAAAVAECEAAEAGLPVTGVLAEGPAVDVLLSEGRTAELLVLGSAPKPGRIGTIVQSVAERAACPVVVVPIGKGSTDRRRRRARVVVGVKPAYHSDATFGFGFELAQRWQATVEAASCWQPDLMDSQSLLESTVAAEKVAIEQQLCDQLAPWLQKYPEVETVATELEHRPVAGLTERTGAADLLVLGRHGSHPVRSLGSVHLAALRRAGCPVALVPSGQSE
jgi:nucleotide-binding universal stress UspA family protein